MSAVLVKLHVHVGHYLAHQTIDLLLKSKFRLQKSLNCLRLNITNAIIINVY